jgi:hypothetical protein
MIPPSPLFLILFFDHFIFMQEEKSDWQKVDFLLELGEWLFVNEFPVQDAVDQVGGIL